MSEQDPKSADKFSLCSLLQDVLLPTGLIVHWPFPCLSSYAVAPPKQPTQSPSHICSPPTLLSIIKLALDEVTIYAKKYTLPFKCIVVFIHYQVYRLSILHCFTNEEIETQRACEYYPTKSQQVRVGIQVLVQLTLKPLLYAILPPLVNCFQKMYLQNVSSKNVVLIHGSQSIHSTDCLLPSCMSTSRLSLILTRIHLCIVGVN